MVKFYHDIALILNNIEQVTDVEDMLRMIYICGTDKKGIWW